MLQIYSHFTLVRRDLVKTNLNFRYLR